MEKADLSSLIEAFFHKRLIAQRRVTNPGVGLLLNDHTTSSQRLRNRILISCGRRCQKSAV